MAKNARRKRHRMLAWIAAGAMAAVVALVIFAVVVMLRTPETPPSAVPPGVVPPGSTTPHPHKPRPASQDGSCPDVQLISVPGTWESSAEDSPVTPTFNPRALLLNVTGPIAQQFASSRVQTYTVPYTAQFHNPMSTDGQIPYDQSRREGTEGMLRAMTDMTNKCPLTSYVIVGFSQGAVIAGDIVSDIGNGRGPVDDDLVLGVTLIADGRREQGVGNAVPPNPPGEGAEITLHEVPILSGMGLTMTGARPGGFGVLNSKTNEICAEGDLICAAPQDAFSPARLPTTLSVLTGGGGQPVHAMYGTPDFWNSDGAPAPVWTVNWAHGLIDNAPHPKHG